MAVTVRIPTTLRPLSGGAKQVEVEPGTLRAAPMTRPYFRTMARFAVPTASTETMISR